MKLYKGTCCHVVLIGILTEIPILHMNAQGDILAVVGVKTCTPQHPHVEHGVTLVNDAALQVKQFGFLGARVWVEGFLQKNNNNMQNIEIMSEKIIFLNDSEPDDSKTSVTHLDHFPLFQNRIADMKQTMLH